MPSSILPPTPTTQDYTQSAAYKSQAENKAEPIFSYETPLALFEAWMAEARESEPNDANAMALSTVDMDGLPDVRMVLLKGVDERGFVFYTHISSAKGQQLTGQPKAALCFHWKSLRRQVRIRGEVIPVSKAEADAYFASRARGSQLGAWSSEQSRPVDSRATLEARIRETEARFEGQDIPRPDFWSGWRVIAKQIEFWRDQPFRLHDRLLFSRRDTGQDWDKTRLYP